MNTTLTQAHERLASLPRIKSYCISFEQWNRTGTRRYIETEWSFYADGKSFCAPTLEEVVKLAENEFLQTNEPVTETEKSLEQTK